MDINTILDIVKVECESCPSLIFGIETAIFDLASKEANINFLKDKLLLYQSYHHQQSL